MLTVACVLRSGGIYDAGWVAKLKAGVARHLPIDHRFLCLSDVTDLPCERIPLKHDWPGWWSKIELFRLPGPVLFFDLDSLPIGDLSDIARQASRPGLTMLRDFYAPDHCGSGVMAWYGSETRCLYDAFLFDPERLMNEPRARMGDQAFIEDVYGRDRIIRWQDVLPGQCVSYKVHCHGGVSPPGIPAGARHVSLHGLPKFGDMPANDPVRRAWEMAA
jgi:hypothetical protein